MGRLNFRTSLARTLARLHANDRRNEIAPGVGTSVSKTPFGTAIHSDASGGAGEATDVHTYFVVIDGILYTQEFAVTGDPVEA